MRDLSVAIREHSGPLLQPARGARAVWTERRGIWIGLEDDAGRVAQGEASPLPGHSTETLQDCARALREIDAIGLASRGLEVLVEPPAELRTLPAAARFALETAIVDAIGLSTGRPAWDVLTEIVERRHPDIELSSRGAPVPLSALLQGETSEALARDAARARARGISCVKLKIDGGRPTAEIVRSIEAARAELGADRALRLDANQTLSPERALEVLEALSAFSPELIEEPVAYDALSGLCDPPIPIALDESLKRPEVWTEIADRLESLRVIAVVLKPALVGGLVAALDLAAGATSRHIAATISHLFDGPVALAAAAHLALAVASRKLASGLDRHRGLAAWPGLDLPTHGATTLLLSRAPGLGLPPLFSP